MFVTITHVSVLSLGQLCFSLKKELKIDDESGRKSVDSSRESSILQVRMDAAACATSHQRTPVFRTVHIMALTTLIAQADSRHTHTYI